MFDPYHARCEKQTEELEKENAALRAGLKAQETAAEQHCRDAMHYRAEASRYRKALEDIRDRQGQQLVGWQRDVARKAIEGGEDAK